MTGARVLYVRIHCLALEAIIYVLRPGTGGKGRAYGWRGILRWPHGPPYGDGDNTEVTDIEIIIIDASRLSDL